MATTSPSSAYPVLSPTVVNRALAWNVLGFVLAAGNTAQVCTLAQVVPLTQSSLGPTTLICVPRIEFELTFRTSTTSAHGQSASSSPVMKAFPSTSTLPVFEPSPPGVSAASPTTWVAASEGFDTAALLSLATRVPHWTICCATCPRVTELAGL